MVAFVLRVDLAAAGNVDADRCAFKAISMAQLILNETDIGKVEIIFNADSDSKARWRHFGLKEAVDMGMFQAFTFGW